MTNNSHYKTTPIEPLAIIESYGLGFVLGNVIKYVLRHPHKGGVDDLHKAVWYLAYHITNSTTKADEVIAALDAVTPQAVAPPADAKQLTRSVTIRESLQLFAQQHQQVTPPGVIAMGPIQIQIQKEREK